MAEPVSMLELPPSAIRRFHEQHDRRGPEDCWPWKGAKNAGYGVLWVSASIRAARAHRVAYQLEVGPVPSGMTLDHLCRNRGCVNPRHLDPCSFGENARRSPLAPYNVKAAWTHCAKGHEFTVANTSIHHGRRRCKTCATAYARSRQGG